MLKRALIPCALLLSVLAACSSGSDDSAAKVHEVSKVQKLDNDRTLSVSPDGKWLAALNDDHELCISTVGGGATHCEDKVRPDETFLTWAPDSSKVAFTESYFRNMLEPDIWTIDTAGKVQDLTDDHATKIPFGQIPSGTHVDVFPSWNDDSSQITFVRLHQPGKGTDEVLSVPAEGGDTKTVGSIKVDAPLNGFAASPDGDTIAWSESPSLPAKVYLADSSGDDARRVTDSGKADNSLLRFSADSDYLLMNNLAGGYNQTFDAHVVSVDDAESASLGRNSTGAVWSSSGHSLLFLRDSGLMLLPDPDGKARAVSGGKDYLAGYGFPVWSDVNSVVYFQRGTAMLLTLG